MTTRVATPLLTPIEARPHTPVYRMHRYFARRPHNVINALIRHYTSEGDVILDPFCGGGTTVVEGLRLRRRVIGVDLNPMATFITRCEVMDLDVNELEQTIQAIARAMRQPINELYRTRCPNCGGKATADWIVWSVVYLCPHCGQPVIAAEAEKVGPGKYRCTACTELFSVTGIKREKDQMIRQHITCTICGFKGITHCTSEDAHQYAELEKHFDTIIEREGLWYPQESMPLDYELRKPNNLVCRRFSDFFSRRNLLALARLLRAINAIKEEKMRYFMQHLFSSVVTWVNRMVVDERHSWAHHAYWLPDVYCENNVWNLFRRRGAWAVRGKRYSQREIGGYFVEAQSAHDVLRGKATCWLLTRSSTDLPLPDGSVDAVITDPPYGGNVQYSELSNFWAVWLPETLGLKGLIDDREEVVTKRYKDGENERYEALLHRVFRECFRVLKDNGWLVITFNNRDTAVWFALLRAVRRAGFHLVKDGVLYQPPIKDYTRTLHQRKDGAIRGDFILSFRKSEAVQNNFKERPQQDIRSLVVDTITELLKKGPATFSQIYQAVIPVLVAHSALDCQTEGINLEKMLFDHFVWEEVPIEQPTGWPLKKTTRRQWRLP